MSTILCGRLLFAFIILICTSRTTNGASLGDICTTDSDCSDLANSECSRMFDCVTGTCACTTGYGSPNNDNCDKILSGFNQPCGSSYYCNETNQECNTETGLCACSTWYDYHQLAGECVFQTYYILTETCGTRYNLECLQTLLDSGGECDGTGTCGCRSGYVFDRTESLTTCRAPRWGEDCEWSPQCVKEFDTSTISDDTSNDIPVCTEKICTCPPSHEHRYVNKKNLCLNRVNDGFERYSIGQNCTHFNECESFFCVKCPGAATGVCMEAPGSAESVLYTSDAKQMAGMLVAGLLVLLVK